MSRQEASRGQRDDCAFWEVTGERGQIWHEPVDERAIYGFTTAVGPEALPGGVPVRNYTYDLVAAVRCLSSRHDLKRHPDDRVRVNGGSWMEVVQPGGDLGWPDEGFLCRYEGGSTVYVVNPNDSGRQAGAGIETRMRNWSTQRSVCQVSCLEVDWA